VIIFKDSTKGIEIGSKKKKRRRRIWCIPVIAIGVVASVILGLYLYVDTRIFKDPGKAEDWAAAQSMAKDTGGNTSNNSDGLDAIDKGDFSKVTTKSYPIIKVKQKDPNIENILLIGIDGGDPGEVGVNRADSMIVASINTKTNTLKLTSLLRDTKTYFPNTDSWHKLNAAYSYGGVGLQIDIINYAYQLDIQQYILADFSQFEKIVDILGGVELALTAQEASYSYIDVGSKAGVYNLDGQHALGYVRTRKIDTDFMRSQRQRNVLTALYSKFKDVSIVSKVSTANACLAYVQTNIPTSELLGKLLTFESTMNSNILQMEIPSDGDGMHTTETSPIWYWNLDWSKEVPRLHEFIYGDN
jgi:cell envelope-related function transcriptional attenuator common domain